MSPASWRAEAGDTESPDYMLAMGEPIWTLSPPGGRGQGEVGLCVLLLPGTHSSALTARPLTPASLPQKGERFPEQGLRT